jgi:site-specific recombinase XerD
MGCNDIPLHMMGDAIRNACAINDLSPSTAYVYVCWARRFVMYYHCRHPGNLGLKEIQGFIRHLVLDRKLSASTQDQALQALRFLYRHVLNHQITQSDVHPLRPKRPLRLPHIPNQSEISRFINRLIGAPRLVALLQYGSGLRLREALQVRIKGFLFENMRIDLGDRMVPMSPTTLDLFKDQIRVRKAQGAMDDEVFLVGNRRKMVNGGLAWQPLHPLVVQKAYRATGCPISSVSLRLAFGAHLLDQGAHVRLVQDLMGQKDVYSILRIQNFHARWPNADVDLLSQFNLTPRAGQLGRPQPKT